MPATVVRAPVHILSFGVFSVSQATATQLGAAEFHGSGGSGQSAKKNIECVLEKPETVYSAANTRKKVDGKTRKDKGRD
jgi:hypothetical protein